MKYIRPDPVAESSGRVLTLEPGALIRLRIHFALQQPGSEDFEGGLPVLDLAPFVLTCNHDSGWFVS
jgi:hypothetical protein